MHTGTPALVAHGTRCNLLVRKLTFAAAFVCVWVCARRRARSRLAESICTCGVSVRVRPVIEAHMRAMFLRQQFTVNSNLTVWGFFVCVRAFAVSVYDIIAHISIAHDNLQSARAKPHTQPQSAHTYSWMLMMMMMGECG